MLTPLTQMAIAILHDIFFGDASYSSESSWNVETMFELLRKLESGGLLRRLPNAEEGALSSYALIRPINELSMLDVLNVLDEPLFCNRLVPEDFYFHHRGTMNKLGVVNSMSRLLLNDIKLSDW